MLNLLGGGVNLLLRLMLNLLGGGVNLLLPLSATTNNSVDNFDGRFVLDFQFFQGGIFGVEFLASAEDSGFGSVDGFSELGDGDGGLSLEGLGFVVVFDEKLHFFLFRTV